MAKLEVGAVAPDFSLQDQNGKTVHLSDFKGKKPVVLIFYPADQTPGCTKQLCEARDATSTYREAGIVVFGVNPGGPEAHQKFVSRYSLTTPLLVDKGLEVATRYDAVLGLGPLKVVNRTVVGIDTEGRVAFYKRGIPSTKEIVAALTAGAAQN
ncbi:MAG TPA: peroxiredoxin [Chloroflexia bacterium]|nr:peroxiredoxin [Chloroflexia bacterium]